VIRKAILVWPVWLSSNQTPRSRLKLLTKATKRSRSSIQTIPIWATKGRSRTMATFTHTAMAMRMPVRISRAKPGSVPGPVAPPRSGASNPPTRVPPSPIHDNTTARQTTRMKSARVGFRS